MQSAIPENKWFSGIYDDYTLTIEDKEVKDSYIELMKLKNPCPSL